MKNAIIVSKDSAAVDFFCEIMKSMDINIAFVGDSSANTHNFLKTNTCQLTVIISPIVDDDKALAIEISKLQSTAVMLCVDKQHFDNTSSNLGALGIFVISKTFNKNIAQNSLRLLCTMQTRMEKFYSQTTPLPKNKLDDMYIVDKAKYLLISYLKLTEPEAHRYIEKQAMNLRITKRTVAEKIINTYGGKNKLY